MTLLNTSAWESALTFAKASGLSLLWDLNSLDFRSPGGASWRARP